MSKKVIVLGGGVAGMSAAHELIERGFEVEVFERHAIPGGKARSIPVFEQAGDHGSRGVHGPAIHAWRRMGMEQSGSYLQRPWLPGEHGFRFFPNFYKHVTDTMSRIPYKNGVVSDNLTNTTKVLLAQDYQATITLPARFPRTLSGFQTAVNDFLVVLAGNVGIPLDEMQFFAARIWQILTSCRERRLAEYEKLGWWQYINAEQCGPEYQKFLGHGITRSLVAAKAQRASTRTIGDIFVQLLLGICDPSISSSDRLLNGPTNAVWIMPWLEYLRSRGVQYHTDALVREIHCAGNRIRSVTIEKDGKSQDVAGDLYLAALPVERMAPLVTPAMTEADPALRNLSPLAENVEWMNGIQLYLKREVPLVHGHAIFIDSPWALTSVSQRQFWPDVDLGQFGDGQTQGILSVDISEWEAIGHCGKAARDCTRDELASEVWDQLKRSLNVRGQTILRDEDLHYWFLDPDIQSSPTQPRTMTNSEPLLVNQTNTWRLRPEAVTAIPNLFLASDYVRTYTDLATMEGANEAARRAVNGMIDACGSNATYCRLWELKEPEMLAPLREYDRARFNGGLPWDDRLMLTAHAVLDLIVRGSTHLTGGVGILGLDNGKQPLSEGSNSPIANSTAEAESLLQISKQLVGMAGRGNTIFDPLGQTSDESARPEAPAPRAAAISSGESATGPRPRIRIVQKQ